MLSHVCVPLLFNFSLLLKGREGVSKHLADQSLQLSMMRKVKGVCACVRACIRMDACVRIERSTFHILANPLRCLQYVAPVTRY